MQKRFHEWQREPWSHKANRAIRHYQYQLRDWGSVAQPQAGAHRGSARAVPPQWAQTLGGTQRATTKANQSNSNQNNQGINRSTPKQHIGESLRADRSQASWDPSTEGAKPPRLDRSQRKNDKRANRRRQHRAARGTSTQAPGEDPCPGARDADAPSHLTQWEQWHNEENKRNKNRHPQFAHTPPYAWQHTTAKV